MYYLGHKHFLARSIGDPVKNEHGSALNIKPVTSPFLSLVMSTKGRQAPIAKLLATLEEQTFRNFELIVVEQNDEPLLVDVLSQEWNFPVTHLHTPGEQGASHGRNRGLARARGDILLFPDDDCWYPPSTFEHAINMMQSKSLDALTGRPTDEAGNSINGRYEEQSQKIVRSNVWTTQIEWIAFWRRSLLDRLNGFDEMIGVGALSPWQSAEGQDLMLRALDVGARAWYDPDLNGHDEGIDPRKADPAFITRARAYGRGMGFVMRKHRVGVVTPSYFLSRSMMGSLLALVTGHLRLSKFHALAALGRLEGLTGHLLR